MKRLFFFLEFGKPGLVPGIQEVDFSTMGKRRTEENIGTTQEDRSVQS